MLLLSFFLINFFFMKITFIFSCSGMFRDVPGCSGMFPNVPECSMFRVLSTPPHNLMGSWPPSITITVLTFPVEKKSTMKNSGVSIFWQYAKNFKSNLVLVVVLILESKRVSNLVSQGFLVLPLLLLFGPWERSCVKTSFTWSNNLNVFVMPDVTVGGFIVTIEKVVH